MITILKKDLGAEGIVEELIGLSTDTPKPTGRLNGSKFFEMDTGKEYRYDEDAEAGSEWVEQPSSGGGGGSVVSVTQVLSSGTKIATITIDGVDTDLFAPEGGGGGASADAPKYLGVFSEPSLLGSGNAGFTSAMRTALASGDFSGFKIGDYFTVPISYTDPDTYEFVTKDFRFYIASQDYFSDLAEDGHGHSLTFITEPINFHPDVDPGFEGPYANSSHGLRKMILENTDPNYVDPYGVADVVSKIQSWAGSYLVKNKEMLFDGDYDFGDGSPSSTPTGFPTELNEVVDSIDIPSLDQCIGHLPRIGRNAFTVSKTAGGSTSSITLSELDEEMLCSNRQLDIFKLGGGQAEAMVGSLATLTRTQATFDTTNYGAYDRFFEYLGASPAASARGMFTTVNPSYHMGFGAVIPVRLIFSISGLTQN